MKVFGAPAALLDSLPTPEDQAFEVFEENWDAVVFFLRASTQWVVGGMGGLIGLNYPSLEFLFKIYKVKDKRGLFEDIMEIEHGALDFHSAHMERETKNVPKL